MGTIEEYNIKRFLEWCARCSYRDKNGTDAPCKDCLNHPINKDPNKKSFWKMDTTDPKPRV